MSAPFLPVAQATSYIHRCTAGALSVASQMTGFKQQLRKLNPFHHRSASPSSATSIPSRTASTDAAWPDTLDVGPSSSTLPPVISSETIPQSHPLSPSGDIVIHVPTGVVHAQLESEIGHQDLSPPGPSHAHTAWSPARTVQSVVHTALRIGAPATEVFPPAKAVVSGIMEILKVIDVGLHFSH